MNNERRFEVVSETSNLRRATDWPAVKLVDSDSPNTKQPRSIPADTPAVWDLVYADMQERDLMGEKKHGVRLQPGNGRDVLKDAYQEALDLVAYLRQSIYERDEQADIATLEQENRQMRARMDRLEQENIDLLEQVECSTITEKNMECRLNLMIIKMASMKAGEA